MLVEELGTALGITAACGYIGLMLAPSFSGLITFFSHWRLAFLCLIPLFIVQLAILHYVKSEWKSEPKPIDNIGSLLYIAMLALFTLGLTELDTWGLILIAISMVMLPIFIRYEKRVEHSVLKVKLFRNLRMVIGDYAAMATYFVTTIAITVLTFHLTYPVDMGLEIISIMLLITPITMIFISIIAGKLSNKRDPRIISGIALLIILVSMVMFSFLEYLPLELIAVACVVQGIGHGFFSSPNNKYVLTLPEEEDLPDTSAILATSKEFGKILSNGIYMLLFSMFLSGITVTMEEFDDALIYTNRLMIYI